MELAVIHGLLALALIRLTTADFFKKQLVYPGLPATNLVKPAESRMACSAICRRYGAANCSRFVYNDDGICQVYGRNKSMETFPSFDPATAVISYVRPAVCPAGWLQSLDLFSCYKIGTEHLNWNAAQSYCRSLAAAGSADLATLRSVEEAGRLIDVASQTVAQTSGFVWIKLNDIAEEGNFVWQEGYAPSFDIWADNEPGTFHQQNCVQMGINVNSKYYKKWDDQLCYYTRYYICEMF